MHTGGLEGMVTQVTMIPELGLGIIVLTNQQEGLAFTAVTNQIKDSYLGISGTDRVTEYAGIKKEMAGNTDRVTDSIWHIVELNKLNSNVRPDFASVEGTYKGQWFGDVVIATKNGKQWFESKRSHKLCGELFYLKGNTYVAKWIDRSMDADAYVNFSLDEAGKGKAISMSAISPATDFSFDFQDLELKRE
jgi:hypothetical protein